MKVLILQTTWQGAETEIIGSHTNLISIASRVHVIITHQVCYYVYLIMGL